MTGASARPGSVSCHLGRLRSAARRSTTHGVIYGHGRSVVARLGGAPEVSLTSPTGPGVTHRWTNLKARVDQVAQARIWAGFHYRFSPRSARKWDTRLGNIPLTA